MESKHYRNEQLDEEAFVDRLVASRGRNRQALIPILQEVQKHYHYLPETILRRICETTGLKAADVAGVSTFYSQFRHRPAGAHQIKVCVGTACHIKGADRVFDEFKRCLNIPEEEDTDSDRLFTVEKVACLGCCMLAPAVQIDDLKYGYLNREKVPSVLADFLQSQNPGNGKRAGSKYKRAEITPRGEIRLCICSSCSAAGAGNVYEEVRRQVRSLRLPATVKAVGCTGISFETPLLEIALSGGEVFRYGRVEPQQVSAILTRHFAPGGIVRRIAVTGYRILERLLTDEVWEPVTRYVLDPGGNSTSLYWGKQKHIVTEHCGSLDPLDFQAYRKHDGFEALKTCLHIPSGEIIRRIGRSGLRGRGGAGYAVVEKWENVRKSNSRETYIVCNGDEGDPGAFMDRMILESFPFRVIEGMAIAAVAVSARRGYLYIRAEYPLAIRRVHDAIGICRQEGILGDDMMGSGKSLDLYVVPGAGPCPDTGRLTPAIGGSGRNRP